MQVQENFSLKTFNSFGIDARASKFSRFDSQNALEEIAAVLPANEKPLILGGGSNMLLTGDVQRPVWKNEIMGIEKIAENDEHVIVRSGAGENWHGFVQHCIANNWAGLENLSLIPGCVGASPMQNIGAYGVEIKDVFYELQAYHLADKSVFTFTKHDCQFGYRESVFKNKFKDQFVITQVSFLLNKNPKFNTSYGAIEQELEKMGVQELSISAVSQAVINIRSSKLPDPKQIGNAGSFFKNPSIPKDQFEALKQSFPEIVGYENRDGSIKLAAGWLIEHAGPAEGVSWKGYRRGDAGVHAKQALVLVNYGNAKGEEIFQLSEDILQSIRMKYGVVLEREVNIM